MEPEEDPEERRKRLNRERSAKYRQAQRERKALEVEAELAARRVIEANAGRGRGGAGTRGRGRGRGSAVARRGGSATTVPRITLDQSCTPDVDMEDSGTELPLTAHVSRGINSLPASATQHSSASRTPTPYSWEATPVPPNRESSTTAAGNAPQYGSDYGNGPWGGCSALDVVMTWMAIPGNIQRIRNADRVTKRNVVEEIARMLAERGRAIRKSDSLIDKVSVHELR
jgi:hypothetical protein